MIGRLRDEGTRTASLCARAGLRFRVTLSRVFNAVVSNTVVKDHRLREREQRLRAVTERKHVEVALRKAEERLRVTVAHAPIGVALVDLRPGRQGRLMTVNAALCKLLGHSEATLLEMGLSSFVHPRDSGGVVRDVTLLSSDEQARVELEVRCLHAEGHLLWVALSGASVPSEEGVPSFAVFHLLDIGERKRFQGQLQHLADHDALTGLYNRRRFEEELGRAVTHSRRYGNHGAVLMIDLDGFKYVNDSLGHSYGDDVIARVGAMLRDLLRATDVIARLGGDEFAVILGAADAGIARAAADKLLAALHDRAVVLSESRHARVTASIGITAFAGDSQLTAEELLVEADMAMYEAKERGKNQVWVYEREGDHHGSLLARQSWLDRLNQALAEDRFDVMAQPVIGICSNGVERYELLLRMRGEDGALIPPGTFLSVAERFDLVQQIDRWVFAEAVRLLRLHAQAGRDISLSVNMSGKTLGDKRILEDITAILTATPVPRNRLVVEITETAAIVNIEQARVVARGLRERGCLFALDDFGAGFASFYYLKHLDFDFLKIDGEFIKGLLVNPTDQLVVQSVVQIARGLRAQTIAEFVGDDLTVTRLRELGVDYGQGYHLGHPQAIDEILPALLSS